METVDQIVHRLLVEAHEAFGGHALKPEEYPEKLKTVYVRAIMRGQVLCARALADKIKELKPGEFYSRTFIASEFKRWAQELEAKLP